MDRTRDYASTFLDVAPGEKRQLQQVTEDTPFRIALLGDFSGRANRGVAAEPRLRGRKPIAVDLDNFDELCGRLRRTLELPGPDEPVSHAVRIDRRFSSRRSVSERAAIQEAAAVAEGAAGRPSGARGRRRPSHPHPSPAMLSSGSLLDDIVSGAETPALLAARQKPDAWSADSQTS